MTKEKKAQSVENKERKTIKRRFEGEVIKDAKDKTVNVLVKIIKMHPKYKKQYTVSKKYQAHNEKNDLKAGNTVLIEECRPLSKTKRFRVVKVLKTNEEA